MQHLGYHVLNRRKPFESEINESWRRRRKSQISRNGVTFQAQVAGKGIRLSRTILGVQPLYEKVKIDGSGAAKTVENDAKHSQIRIGGGFSSSGLRGSIAKKAQHVLLPSSSCPFRPP